MTNGEKQKFAVFDIDGTLIRWQLYHAVVDRLAKKGLLGKDAKMQLNEARMHWKRREHPDAFHQYERSLIAIYQAALPTLNPVDFDQTVSEIIQEYKHQVYTYTRDLVKQLKNDGYMLLAISGSHSELVEQIAKEYGFDAWQGSTYQRTSDSFTGKAEIASMNKQERLRAMIKQYGLSLKDSYAVGDSASDAPILEIVEHPIAFNPDMKLFEIAAAKGWDVVIERKNVTYELKASDGTYLLA